jgi:hypothetical protein
LQLHDPEFRLWNDPVVKGSFKVCSLHDLICLFNIVQNNFLKNFSAHI